MRVRPRQAATLSEAPLDIVPAYEVHAMIPPKGNKHAKKAIKTTEKESIVDKWVSEQDMGGPEPFGLVSEELAPFSDNIKELVETDNPVLSKAARVREALDLWSTCDDKINIIISLQPPPPPPPAVSPSPSPSASHFAIVPNTISTSSSSGTGSASARRS